ncbi:dihydrofolate synthase / folylpolyglutamate synthase [Natronincola peptidivorans]|uniref:tetrahydrofolate synthase n=1 Tax=Natronincola peptidivorans TaxID=426128 RepID=A0A1I0FVL8_9FIRM|nr:folylpolyglutamate synthase/dihydrofolate synthase family protein [Natronincola peptidivorans]SET62325.1 dihydrofolate synthase / folylpolyglutamate synthase [Natronincola peptidivorans]
MNFWEAIQFIEKTHALGGKLPLESMEKILHLLGNPQEKLKIIHVAGTNGKGSTSSFLHSMLAAEGYRVGLFTSPHLQCFTDRIRINGVNISQEDFAAIATLVSEKILPLMDDGLNPPALFDIMTLMAFIYYAKEKIDYVILEVGLGGLNDATNIIKASLASVITPIGVDHIDVLGSDIRKIAAHKAGIIKPNGLVVYHWQETAVAEVIQATAEKNNAKVYSLQEDNVELLQMDIWEQIFDLNSSIGSLDHVKIRMLGKHQIYNASLAALTLMVLRNHQLITIADDSIYKGLYNNFWGGRLELLHQAPFIFIDGAHNLQGAGVLKSAIEQYFSNRKINMVIGMLEDKDVEGVLNTLVPLCNKVVFTRPNSHRAMEPEELSKNTLLFGKETAVISSLEEAVVYGIQNTAMDEITIFTGSLYLVGDVKTILLDYLHNEQEAS